MHTIRQSYEAEHPSPLPPTYTLSKEIEEITREIAVLIGYLHKGNRNDHAIPFPSYYNQNGSSENFIEIIVNEAAILYEKMVKEFTNKTMTNAAAGT